MKQRKTVIKAVAILLFLAAFLSSGTAQTAEPQIQNISIYNVTGSTGEARYTGGEYLASGLNTTYLINQTRDNENYRFTFRLNNTGDAGWTLEGGDELLHEGIDTGWSINRTWYNISGTEYVGGSFSGGTVEWDTSQGGILATGENLYAKYIVEANLPSSQVYDQRFLANDTSENNWSEDEHILDLNRLGRLSLQLEEPPNGTVLTQNKTFTINSTISCTGGECGEIEAVARYNQSSEADTMIPEDSGEPFHTVGVNSETCSLLDGESCRVTWEVNATGQDSSYHLLDTRASSSFSEINTVQTADAEVEIRQVVMLNMTWSTTDFGLLDPGDTGQPAIGNHNLTYNISVLENSNDADIWIKGSDLQSQNSDYHIGIGNMSYALENLYSSSYSINTTYDLVKRSVSAETVLNTFYWLDVPTGIYTGDYNGSISFKANVSR